jgi:peptide/nickel transport system permease protein
VLRWDWGDSWKLARGQPVTTVIGSRIQNTIILMATVTVLSLMIAIPIGIISAVKQYSKLDYAVTTFSFFGISMPVFWFGLLMIMLFTLQFQKVGAAVFPVGRRIYDPRHAGQHPGRARYRAPYTLADRIVHLFLPVTVLTMLYLAGWGRFMRSSMLEVLRQDYVRTARAKGLLERTVIFQARHPQRPDPADHHRGLPDSGYFQRRDPDRDHI